MYISISIRSSLQVREGRKIKKILGFLLLVKIAKIALIMSLKVGDSTYGLCSLERYISDDNVNNVLFNLVFLYFDQISSLKKLECLFEMFLQSSSNSTTNSTQSSAVDTSFDQPGIVVSNPIRTCIDKN